jgi:hypothetical protein
MFFLISSELTLLGVFQLFEEGFLIDFFVIDFLLWVSGLILGVISIYFCSEIFVISSVIISSLIGVSSSLFSIIVTSAIVLILVSLVVEVILFSTVLFLSAACV